MTDLKPCPFCGSKPERRVTNNVLHVTCPNCVSIGYHNHVRLGCLADHEWNTRLPAAPRKESEDLQEEVNRLREREKHCATLDEAEKLALIRGYQEIRDAIGLLSDDVSPREIVAKVKEVVSRKESEES